MSNEMMYQFVTFIKNLGVIQHAFCVWLCMLVGFTFDQTKHYQSKVVFYYYRALHVSVKNYMIALMCPSFWIDSILEQPSKQKVALLQAKSLSSWGNPIGPKQWRKVYRNMVRYCFYFHLMWIGVRNFIGQVYFFMISCRYSTNPTLIVYTYT